METIEELRQMPVVTVEQVTRFRDAALRAISVRESQLLSLGELSGYCVADAAPDMTCLNCDCGKA